MQGSQHTGDPFAAGDSDAALSRRDFLERTAYAAGLAGMASLPASTLISEAARAYSRARPLPKPRNLPIDHFVIVMMENRSFDHYFGWASEYADAVQKQKFRDHRDDAESKFVRTFHASRLGDSEWQGCGHPDPGHGWDSGRAQLKDGFLAKDSGNDEFALCYYDEGDLGFIHEAAVRYTLFDRFFCSLLASTWPNRYYKWSAQSGGIDNNDPPVSSGGNQWETLFDRAARFNPANLPDAGGPTYRYYNSDLPFSAVWGPRAVPWTRPLSAYYEACATGTLENIVIVDPPFRDGGGGDGLSADEHPHGDVRLGQAWMADVVRAFVDSPHYRRGAIFVIYDEWGGFFDHVRPPSVPDDRRSSSLDDDFGQMGFRIPAVALSPYTLRDERDTPRVNHGLYGHESILKLITYRFGLGHLVKRDEKAHNIGRAFNFDKENFEVPDLPNPSDPVTQPCSTRDSERAEDSDGRHGRDLDELEDLADRFGFEVGDGKPVEIFREPDKIRRAAEEQRRRDRRRRRRRRRDGDGDGDAPESAPAPSESP